ncbi:MAG TPA: polysaccharide biosynthesis tyrosine autokinase [Candidatus Baltobacteraceae bacterium]|nr:polysaccharide biosynthesis tyrosine autokinase [Candidatus Baltobacteraceae bacterium]
MIQIPTAGGGMTPYAASSQPETQNELGGLFRVLLRRIRPMLAIFAGFVALVLVLSLVLPKTYTSTVKLIAGNPGTTGFAGSDNATSDTQVPVLNALLIATGMQSTETYVELFQEDPVAQQVISQLGLKISPKGLLKKIDVKPVINTSIIGVSVTWGDANTSARIANAFGDVVVDRQRQLVSAQAGNAISFLNQQLPQAQKAMNDAQTALATFEAQHHIADINAQTQSLITALSTLDAKVGQVQADRQQAQAELSSAQAQLKSTPATITGGETVAQNPVLGQLQSQLSQIDVQLQTALQQYTEKHPTVIALRNQEAQVKREIAQQQSTIVANTNTVPNPVYQQIQQQDEQYATQIASDNAQLVALKTQQTQMNPQLAGLPAQTATLANLQRNAKSAEDVYTALQGKYNNAQIARDTALSDVTITQPADPRLADKKPNLLVNLLLGIGLGAILAILGAFVIDYLDNTIKDDRDVEQELALPSLAAIPLVKMRNGTPELPWVRTMSIEAFLQLVTSMKYASDKQLSTVVVTSPTQGDGKSTVALNVAIAMGELEPRVLLVDADLRRASLHHKLRMKNERGLSDILVGRSRLENVVQSTRYPGLDLLTSGTPTPNPIKLLESGRMDEFLREAQERYRCVVIDGTALSVNVDSAVVARKADGTVIVLSANQTDLRAAKQALRRMHQVGVRNILGYVLNRVVPRKEDYEAYELRAGTELEPTEETMITA